MISLGTLVGARIVSATASDGGSCTLLKGKSKGASCNLAMIAGGTSDTVTIVAKASGKVGARL